VPYEPGTLKVVGMKRGKETCSKEISTAGEPYSIKLDYMMEEFVGNSEMPPYMADGKDVVVIKASVIDAEGNVVPVADNMITFSVEGDQKIIGVGNGNIASHELNKTNFRKAYNGLCAIIVQTSTTAGDFTVTASSPGLVSGEIVVNTVK
jgi:beta-galactosidase